MHGPPPTAPGQQWNIFITILCFSLHSGIFVCILQISYLLFTSNIQDDVVERSQIQRKAFRQQEYTSRQH